MCKGTIDPKVAIQLTCFPDLFRLHKRHKGGVAGVAPRARQRRHDPLELDLDEPLGERLDAEALGRASEAFLARMEARVAIETLLDRVAGLALAPGYRFDPNPVFWALGPRTLRVVLDRG